LEPLFGKVSGNFRSQKRKEANNRFINELMERHFDSQQQTAQQKSFNEEPKPDNQYSTLLTSEQIEQFNALRAKIAISEARQFPQIRLSGHDMPNLVPGAGLFTAKIKRHGSIQNLVVMLSSMPAVSEFEKLCYSYGSLPKDFWAEGYLLPSRNGTCYSVLLVTSFRFCGRKLAF
jgi:hypothetical protein